MHKSWWQEAVVYQVYPRSFQDSNGDGIGDLQGIIQHLDYIKELGVDVIWLNPIYKSPNADNGYDIADYQQIMPEFGTMADFQQLLKAAHARGLKIMMDLVVNHTSDEHPWFQAAKQSRTDPHHDWYIWRDPVDGHAPTNWRADFGGSAWTYVPEVGQYYLHLFAVKQPDLNWTNPAVRKAVFDMMTWWCDQGIDGFRMDVINLISKPDVFADDPHLLEQPNGNSLGLIANGPHVHEYLRAMNKAVLSKHDLMTVGEAPGVTPALALQYTGFDRHELEMVFQFKHVGLDNDPQFGKWSLKHPQLTDLKHVLSDWQTALHGKAWNSLYWDNHDQARAVSRFGDDRPAFRVHSAKMLAATLHFLEGTPYIYQGEELGMTNVAFPSIHDYRDLDTLNAWHELVEQQHALAPEDMLKRIHRRSRDNARTPMQWSSAPQAGFTAGTPWLAVNPNYTDINATAALADSDSVFFFYQKLIRLRKQYPDLIVYGAYTLLDPDDPDVYMYQRHATNQELLVISNFTDQTLTRDIAKQLSPSAKLLISNYDDDAENTLRPYETKAYLIIER